MSHASKNKSLLHDFFCILVELKVYHWSTRSFARHKASDQCFTDLQGLIDKYMEATLGRVPRDQIFNGIKPLHVNLNAAKSDKYIESRLQNFINRLEVARLPPDLANIRDDMLTTLQTCLYLFSLA